MDSIFIQLSSNQWLKLCKKEIEMAIHTTKDAMKLDKQYLISKKLCNYNNSDSQHLMKKLALTTSGFVLALMVQLI